MRYKRVQYEKTCILDSWLLDSVTLYNVTIRAPGVTLIKVTLYYDMKLQTSFNISVSVHAYVSGANGYLEVLHYIM